MSDEPEALRLLRERDSNPEGFDPEDVVWFNTIDNAAYAVLCKRKPEPEHESHATMTVVRVKDAKVILEEDVSLSYGAIFGPDVNDLDLWQEKAVAAVDLDV